MNKKIYCINKRNIKIAIIIMSAIMMFATVGVTFAYLKDKTDTKVNTFSGGGVNIGTIVNNGSQAVESGLPIVIEESYEDISIAVKNIDLTEYPTVDTYVRVRLIPCIRYDTGNASGNKKTGLIPVDMKDKISYTFSEDNSKPGEWVYTGDRNNEAYFYYTVPLEPDEVTPCLISSIKYSGYIPEDAHLELQVFAEGVAAEQKDAEGNSGLSMWFSDHNDFSSLISSNIVKDVNE